MGSFFPPVALHSGVLTGRGGWGNCPYRLTVDLFFGRRGAEIPHFRTPSDYCPVSFPVGVRSYVRLRVRALR